MFHCSLFSSVSFFLSHHHSLSRHSHSVWTLEDITEGWQRTHSTIDFHLKYRWLVCGVSTHNHDRVVITIIMIAAVNNSLCLAEAVSANTQTAQSAWVITDAEQISALSLHSLRTSPVAWHPYVCGAFHWITRVWIVIMAASNKFTPNVSSFILWTLWAKTGRLREWRGSGQIIAL